MTQPVLLRPWYSGSMGEVVRSEEDVSPTERALPDNQPTAWDHESARIRRDIAEKMQGEYDACQAWAVKVFGPGWEPSCRHFLLEKDHEDHCRKTGERPKASFTVYTAKNDQGEARHFTV